MTAHCVRVPSRSARADCRHYKQQNQPNLDIINELLWIRSMYIILDVEILLYERGKRHGVTAYTFTANSAGSAFISLPEFYGIHTICTRYK